MDQHLVHIRTMRPVKPLEIQHVLIHLDRTKGEQIWLLGTKGSRRQVEDLLKYTPDQWKKFCEAGLVYVTHEDQWAFSRGVDAETKLPAMMVPYDEVYRRRLQGAAPAAPPAHVQPTLLDQQPAEQATTQPT